MSSEIPEIPSELKSFIEGMPKTELHMHLEGSFEPKLAFKMAERNGIKPGSPEFPWKTVQELRNAYNFNDLESFLKIYNKVAKVLLMEQDFHDLAQAYCNKALSENIRHAEVFFDPQTHTSRNIPFKTIADGFNKAFHEARQKGLSIHLIASFLRDHPVGTPEDPAEITKGFPSVETATAWATVKQIVEYNKLVLTPLTDSTQPEYKIIGVGLDNNELGYPPSLFTAVYQHARENGLLATAHAGEEGPPSYVWEAIEDLKCVRIDHGVRVVEDPQMVATMAIPRETAEIISAYHQRQKIPATVCPLSNYKLKVFSDPTETNIVKMLDLGIMATVNSDDPAYFGGYVAENYLFLLRYLAPGIAKSRPIDLADVYRLCVNGFEASWLGLAEKNRFVNEVVEYFIDNPGLLYKDFAPFKF